ncbi:MAG TPA: SCO family protein, partial [Vicinamibacteria bacterium]|nr:SCO family protein [Vicinamibacteria bacterium]
GVEYSPKDLRLALVDAAGGRIGTAVDQVLLYCYQYDPKTGRYSASILNVVRLGGLLTMLALGTFILTAGRRRRADPRAGRTPTETA